MSDNVISNYNIIVLGATGSGKTVFLASMYKKLSTQSLEIPFFIETNANQRTKLVGKYYEIASSGSERWPSGTTPDEVSEWHFTCSVRSPSTGLNYQALRFTYLDYSGGRITDPLEDDNEADEFEKRAAEADAVLGIIDGQHVLRLMQALPGKGGYNHFALRDLPATVNLMQKCKGPIHFVITKWDLLEGLYSLKDIRNRLFEIQEFKNIVEQRIEQSIVRLIPVSSVGKGFAILQANGSMLKTGVQPRPMYVEMPFCCVFPDCFATEAKKLADKEKSLNQLIGVPSPKYTFWDKIGAYLGSFVSFAGMVVGLDSDIVNVLSLYMGVVARNKREELAREKERLLIEQKKSLREVQSQQTALRHAVNSFLSVVSKLDMNLPGSDLSR
jgi:hypothetical protein